MPLHSTDQSKQQDVSHCRRRGFSYSFFFCAANLFDHYSPGYPGLWTALSAFEITEDLGNIIRFLGVNPWNPKHDNQGRVAFSWDQKMSPIMGSNSRASNFERFRYLLKLGVFFHYFASTLKCHLSLQPRK